GGWWVGVAWGGGSSGAWGVSRDGEPPLLLRLFWKAERITSAAKKFLPSIGTIMICSLSERRSAMIFWMSMGFCLRTLASYFMRSESAAAVTRMRLASASARLRWRSTSAFLSMSFGWA